MSYHITRFSTGPPQHCTPTNEFLVSLSTYTGICIPTPQASVSTLLGCLSICSWLFAQLPQLIKNYKIKSTAGLSVFFLAEWLLGDLTNLVGGILTHQAGWQVIVASYYVFVDTCLVIQFYWYSRLRSRFADGSVHSASSSIDDMDGDMINSLSPINSNFGDEPDATVRKSQDDHTDATPSKPVNAPQFFSVNYEKNNASSPISVRSTSKEMQSWLISPSPRTVMYAATLTTLVSRAAAAPAQYSSGMHQPSILNVRNHTTAEFVGTVISWSSTFLYLGSRLPQLYKNWRLQSTAGLSPFLFIAAFCGNFFYTSSLLTSPNAWNDFGPYGGHGWAGPDGSQRGPWIVSTAPFFLGAFGCLGLDVMIGVQFMMYGEAADKVVKVRDGHGHSHWERVSGWMRGWIPTVSREKVVDLAQSQRLLSESREVGGRSHHSTIYGGI